MAGGWISTFFEFKCLDIFKRNIDLAWQKLSNPQEMFKLEMGSPLLGKILSDGFSGFIKGYVKSNATALIGASAQAISAATGRPNPLQGMYNAYNALWFTFVGTMSSYNDYLLYLTQKTAEDIVRKSEVKLVDLQAIRQYLVPLYNTLLLLSQGKDDLYETYLAQLRLGLFKLYRSERSVTLVANTLLRTGYFLTNRFDAAKEDLRQARLLVQPKLNESYYKQVTPPPYDEEFDSQPWKTEAARVGGNANMFRSDKEFGNVVGDSLSLLARSVGIPATEEQFANMKLVSYYTSELLKGGKYYLEHTFKLNASLTAFPLALDQLVDSFPDFMKKLLEIQFGNFLTDMAEVRKSMASHLNGRGEAIGPSDASFSTTGGFRPSTYGDPTVPVIGYKPVIPVVLTMSVAWSAQLAVLNEWFDSIPVSALTANNLNRQAVNEYKNTVGVLKTYNDVFVGGQAVLGMEAGVEELTQFEQQMLLFLSSATIAMYTFSIDPSILAVGRNLLQRCDVNIARTQQIIRIMKRWSEYKLPAQEILNQMHANLINIAETSGYDKFIEAVNGGDFKKLLTFDPQNASTLGTALAVVSFLHKCFAGEDKDTSILDDVRDSITEDLSLFNFSLEVDLDFNIFKGISECVKFRGLGKKFDLEEALCTLVKDLVGFASNPISSQWDKIKESLGNTGASIGNSLGFDGESPGSAQTK